MKNFMRQSGVSILIFMLSFCYSKQLSAQYEKIDLSNNAYDTAFFKKVLPPEGIKSIIKPEYKILKEALKDTILNYIHDNDWILIVEHSNKTKLYPIMPLIWHEAVNDNIEDLQYTVTYCVLTGSAMVFDRNMGENSKKTFGVSGCLYNSNLVMYDYQTRSTWSQLFAKAYSGIEKDKNLNMIKFTWAKYSYVKKHYLKALILLGDYRMPNFKKMYGEFPFKGLDIYSKHDTLRFPANYKVNPQYFSKEKFLYFPDKKIAIKLDKLNEMGEDFVKVKEKNNQIVYIKPLNDNTFITLYYFALKTFYPDAKIIK